MPTITLPGVSNPYDVYADVDEADNYLAAALSATAWRAASAETKAMALITATRIFDRTCWAGTQTQEVQALAWPRTGTGIDGVDDSVIPDDIISGAIELANSLVAGSTAETNATPGAQGLQIIKAGSVMLQYFRGAEGPNAQNDRFPLPVQEYVRRYLCGAGVNIVGIATGATSGTTDADTSVTNQNYGFNEGI